MKSLICLALLFPFALCASNRKEYREVGTPGYACPGEYLLNSPWYPDEENCSCYYVCRISGDAVRMCCPLGLWWSQDTKTCLYFQDFNTKHQERCLRLAKGVGTTKQLREIFIGRCWEYQLFRNPGAFQEGYRNCGEIFDNFARVFVNKAACNVIKPEHYNNVIDESIIRLPRDSQILWSGTYEIAQAYAGQGKRGFTVEDTMIGYILNDLTWCGATVAPGINFDSCPSFASCPGHVMASFWAKALETYARQAEGVITVILNGSRADGAAFRNNSFFARHEFPNLQPSKITKMKIWLVHDLNRPIRETCTSDGSVRTLQRLAEAKGLVVECQDNPSALLHLLCAYDWSNSQCQFTSPPSPLVKYKLPKASVAQRHPRVHHVIDDGYGLYQKHDNYVTKSD